MTTQPKITDINIRELVNAYINDKTKLPSGLKYVPIGEWNVSEVTDLGNLFSTFNEFNEPLNKWNVSNVTNMEYMFSSCKKFNQPLNDWDVSNVTNMEFMFEECISFNQSLNDWDVSKVTKMNTMFAACGMFDQPLDKWDVGSVIEMEFMFCYSTKFNQSLNNWNVSNVGNMTRMFMDCINFDKPLNNWNVSNVTDMSYMFTRCKKFNQPLNNWNVSNVTDMTHMFAGCTNFNQPLVRWNTRNVRDDDRNRMFYLCRIEERNKPTFNRIVEPPEVDANAIHRESAKINYTKLNAFLKGKVDAALPPAMTYPTYINENLLHMIHTNDEQEATKTLQKNGLNRIMSERLNNVSYGSFSIPIRKSIFYTIKYVLTQPPEFQKVYVDTFIKDCVHAYEGADGMTCAAGALERFVISLVTACQSMLSDGAENEDYEKIVAIIVANPAILIPEYIHDWYKLHKTGTENAFPSETSTETKRKDLRKYLLGFLPEDGELIDSKIREIADIIGYDDDDFTYGGKRKHRKTERIRNNKKNKTKKHSKTKKIKKNKTKKTKKQK
jgi:surface protein